MVRDASSLEDGMYRLEDCEERFTLQRNTDTRSQHHVAHAQHVPHAPRAPRAHDHTDMRAQNELAAQPRLDDARGPRPPPSPTNRIKFSPVQPQHAASHTAEDAHHHICNVPSLRHHATRPLCGQIHPCRNRVLHFVFHVFDLQSAQCASYLSIYSTCDE